MDNNSIALVRGGGDLGTGVVYHLHKAGIRTVITELSHPKMVRHTVCLGAAVYRGTQQVEDLHSKVIALEDFERDSIFNIDREIPVIIDEDNRAIATIRPDIIFDCRMLKYDLPDQRHLAPVVVGLGPGFIASARQDDGSFDDNGNVDYVIETQRGEHLAEIISHGRAIPNTGIPGVIAGESERRLLRAPQAGIFRGIRAVGDIISAGDIVGYVGDLPVISSIAGRLRGLVHDGLEVNCGEKIGDCDPRGEMVSAFKISDKSHSIGEAALKIFTMAQPRLYWKEHK